jgi:hypothetical protein
MRVYIAWRNLLSLTPACSTAAAPSLARTIVGIPYWSALIENVFNQEIQRSGLNTLANKRTRLRWILLFWHATPSPLLHSIWERITVYSLVEFDCHRTRQTANWYFPSLLSHYSYSKVSVAAKSASNLSAGIFTCSCMSDSELQWAKKHSSFDV